ncbi:MAG: hypothetical protein N3B11_03780 [Coriobacteriia bacterium]|nr:hypothetical protein [Coriobacteriia bacterium]
MVFLAVVAVCGACAYLVGYAFIAPRESFLRSSGGGLVLGVCVLAALATPAAASALAGAAGPGVQPAWFRPAWIAAETVGLLAGMRAWRLAAVVRTGRWSSLSETPAARAATRMGLADSLDAALDALAETRMSARDLDQLAPALRHLGARFWHQLPERQGDLYALVARHVPPEAAAVVTGLLLEGAGRR